MFNVGDKVKCVKQIKEYPSYQVGKVYDVLAYEDYGNSEGWNNVKEGEQQIVVNHYRIKGFFELYKEEKPVSKVNYNLLNDSVVVSFNGELHAIRRGDARFKSIVTCIKEKRLNDIPALLTVVNLLEKAGLTEKNGKLFLGSDQLPDSLGVRIQQLIEEEMPIDILLKFWENLKQNPSFNSRKMLYDFLSHNGHPLTEDGCFIAYRGIREDFKDMYTGKFDNSIGAVCEVKRDEVDDNPNNTCSHGLHVACFDYARSFGQKLVEVKVNPKDVIAVPVDYNGTKMRVCKFEVLAECKEMLTGAVYGVQSTAGDDLKDDDVGYDYFPMDFCDDDDCDDYSDYDNEENE